MTPQEHAQALLDQWFAGYDLLVLGDPVTPLIAIRSDLTALFERVAVAEALKGAKDINWVNQQFPLLDTWLPSAPSIRGLFRCLVEDFECTPEEALANVYEVVLKYAKRKAEQSLLNAPGGWIKNLISDSVLQGFRLERKP